MALLFRNRGNLDIRAFTLMGVSVKVTGTPFGFFGTGIKYAVAILLRTGHEITVRTDGHTYRLLKSDGDFRGREIQQIVLESDLDGERTLLPFVTDYGGTWSVQDAFRELWCNTHDEEEGTVTKIGEDEAVQLSPDGWTDIIVRGPEIDDAYDKRWSQFMDRDQINVVHSDDFVEAVHPDGGLSTDSVFYQGVRVLENPKHSSFVYNIREHVWLTENRTLQYPWQVSRAVMKSVSSSRDKDFIRAILNSNGHIEAGIDWSDLSKVSAEFADTAEIMRREGTLSSTAAKMFGRARAAFSHHGYEEATLLSLTTLEREKLTEALGILSDRGIVGTDERMAVEFHSDLDAVVLSADGRRIMIPAESIGKTAQEVARDIVVGVSLTHHSQVQSLATVLVTGEWPKRQGEYLSDEDEVNF